MVPLQSLRNFSSAQGRVTLNDPVRLEFELRSKILRLSWIPASLAKIRLKV